MINQVLCQMMVRRAEFLARMEIQCVAELNEVRHMLAQAAVRVQMAEMLLGSIAREAEFIRGVVQQLQDVSIDGEGD